MKTLVIAVVAALSVVLVGSVSADGTPAQAKKIRELRVHIAKQNRAIDARNDTVSERNATIAGLNLQVHALTTDRDGVSAAAEALRAQLVSAAAEQIKVMPPDDAWQLVPVVAARIRMGCFYDTSVFFGSGGYTSWSLTRTGFCL